MDNTTYFNTFCEIAFLLLNRNDKFSPPIKSIFRHTVREAINHSSDGPGYDNKLGAQFMSQNAFDQMKRGDLKNLVGDHAVPVSVVVDQIYSDQQIYSTSDISRIIRKLGVRAVITKQEDNILKKKKLTKNMPDDWDGISFDSRYKAVGIKLLDNQYMQFKKRKS